MTLAPYPEPNKICLTFLKSAVKVSTKLSSPLPANIKSTACFQVGQVKHMPDVISDTNGKLCVGSYHMWRLLSNPDNYSLNIVRGTPESFRCAASFELHHHSWVLLVFSIEKLWIIIDKRVSCRQLQTWERI